LVVVVVVAYLGTTVTNCSGCMWDVITDMVRAKEIFGLVRKLWKLFYFPFYYYLLVRI
jgi:hypothetical protein